MSTPQHPQGTDKAGGGEQAARLARRDPVEHALWSHWLPAIGAWGQRPYDEGQARVLNQAAATVLFPGKGVTEEVRAKRWREEQLHFIAMVEHRSAGAISGYLEKVGEAERAAWVRRLGTRVGALVAQVQEQQERERAGMKELLAGAGLPTLLSDERYEPKWPFRFSKEVPDVLPFAVEQTSLLGRAVVKVKDAYDPQEPDDGLRVFIEREPPRTVLAPRIEIDLRMHALRPSRELFDWFGQDPERWVEFQHHYHRELRQQPGEMERVLKQFSQGPVTLLHKKRGEFSIARALANYLLKHYPHVFEAG